MDQGQLAERFHIGLTVTMARLLPFHIVLPAPDFDGFKAWQQRIPFLCQEQHADDKESSGSILSRFIDIRIEFLRWCWSPCTELYWMPPILQWRPSVEPQRSLTRLSPSPMRDTLTVCRLTRREECMARPRYQIAEEDVSVVHRWVHAKCRDAVWPQHAAAPIARDQFPRAAADGRAAPAVV